MAVIDENRLDMASSSSSSSPSSSSSEYMSEPVTLVYPSASAPFISQKPCRPFRVITPASTLQQNKRKRDLLDTGTGQQRAQYPEMNQFRVVVRQPLVAPSPGSSFGPSGKLKAKPPKAFNTKEDLLSALRTTCVEDPEVDFSGSYLVAGSDADTISDKQRVQMVTNDIWKATGYRFTVKDHPPTERGHKTRLWCSQDEARRSKHRGNGDIPRLSKQGDLFAKPRYACRSRLMIACLPDGQRGGRIVTIRMHHYMRHEAYFESVETNTNAPAVHTPPPPLMTPQFLNVITAPLPPHLMGRMDLPPAPVAPPPALHEQEGEWDLSRQHPHSHPHPHPHPHPRQEPIPEPSPSPSPHFASARAPPPIDPQLELHHPPPPQLHHPPLPPPLPPHPAQTQMTPEEFQRRMRTHIARIRDFCDGLEYQIQFNDYRMLEALEQDAAPFLGLLEDCLREEGR